MKEGHRWLAALGCALILAAPLLTPAPAQAVNADLGLKVTWCNNVALVNAAVQFTVYENNSAMTSVTAYTNSSGEVVQTLSVEVEDRVSVAITPFGSPSTYHRDYKYAGSSASRYMEWVQLDAGDGPPPGGDTCVDTAGSGNPIDFNVRVP